MALNFPTGCDTPRRKMEFSYAMIKRLRLLHNRMGDWYRDGITQAEYDQLPNKIKNKLPYTPKLSENKWLAFKAKFRDYMNVVDDHIGQARKDLQDSAEWTPNVDDVID